LSGKFSSAAAKTRTNDAGFPISRQSAAFHLELLRASKSLRHPTSQTIRGGHHIHRIRATAHWKAVTGRLLDSRLPATKDRSPFQPLRVGLIVMLLGIVMVGLAVLLGGELALPAIAENSLLIDERAFSAAQLATISCGFQPGGSGSGL
jgi:hypothetical protein